jgi:NAD(P)H-flavin reductase
VLTILLAVIAWSAREKRRKEHFERFWWIHNIGLLLWPPAMYVHGANAWIGVGIPLVVFTTSGPLLAVYRDQLSRWMRPVLSRQSTLEIRSAVVRPGRTEDEVQGAIVQIAVEKPRRLWWQKTGTYAFVCMPEYSRFQWHPFTISSGQDDENVEFCIAAVGDWTKELARRILASKQMDGKLPKLLLDGPFVAPAQSALSHEILIAVGAGVGITPFLSLLSTVTHSLADLLQTPGNSDNLPLKQMHLFWMTRSADEFLFAKPLFTLISSNPELQKRIILHLHVTGSEPPRNAQAFLFRETLRRQSQHDRTTFSNATDQLQKRDWAMIPSSFQCPACWYNSSYQDVLWVSSLFNSCSSDLSHEMVFGEETLATPKPFYTLATPGTDDQRPPEMAEPQTLETPQDVMKKNSTLGALASRFSWKKPGRKLPTKVREAEIKSLPLIFGRPDFAKEVRAIGKANPLNHVHIYICGNDKVVQDLTNVAEKCNKDSKRRAGDGQPYQNFNVRFERFD